MKFTRISILLCYQWLWSQYSVSQRTMMEFRVQAYKVARCLQGHSHPTKHHLPWTYHQVTEEIEFWVQACKMAYKCQQKVKRPCHLLQLNKHLLNSRDTFCYRIGYEGVTINFWGGPFMISSATFHHCLHQMMWRPGLTVSSGWVI